MRRDGADVTEVATADGDEGAVVVAAGARVGRFVVGEVIGHGGMGVVFAAHDPDLDRAVAIKLLQPGRGAASTDAARMLREARALAKVAHPNVLAVHEVGMYGAQVFLATELAAGGTLRRWCREARPWREVRALFVQAARGIEAAHRAGLVHRDVKPENLLVGADGRVRVADFGLVGIDAGEVAGTPAYMAPEQHARGELGPAADQFALCVSLWEALYGARPFAGTGAARIEAIEAGRIEPAEERGVPAWLQTVVRRGLAARPEDRWPSMAVLIERLERDPEVVRRRRMGIAAAAAGAAGLIAAAIVMMTSRAPAVARCGGMERPIARVWNAARAAEVRAGFAKTGRPYAADTSDRVAARLDTYAQGWIAARIDACEDTARGERSAALLDRRMACLDRRLGELDALVGVLASHPEVDVMDRAVASAAKLAPLAACEDLTALEAAIAPPADPATRAEVETVRRAIAEALALGNTGRAREGLAIAQGAATAAAATGYPPVVGEALLRRGLLEAATGDAAAADATLEQAVLAAAGARDDALAARVWTERLFVIGVLRARADDALALRTVAEAAVERAGGDALLAAGLTHNVANVLAAHQRNAEALPFFERAIAGKERVYGPDHPAVATSLNGLGVAYEQLGRAADAAVPLRRALAIWEAAFGPDHPDVAGALNNLGNVLMRAGAYDESIAAHERALGIRERALGARHPAVADSHDNLALALDGARRFEDARRHQALGLAIRIEALGADHVDVAYSLHNIGSLLERMGRPAEALDHHRRALAVWERARGPDHAEVGYPLTGIASAQLALGHAEEARIAAVRAVALLADPDVPPEDLALGRFVLARAEWALGRDRKRALATVRAVRAVFAETAASEALAEADAWLAARAL